MLILKGICKKKISFFFIFLHFFYGLYVYFLVFKKILVDNQLFFSRFCPIKSSFNDISYLDIMAWSLMIILWLLDLEFTGLEAVWRLTAVESE